jgi:hypothetical protein
MKQYFAGLWRNSFLLTAASFFADTSTEMLYPILPVFLTRTLKASSSENRNPEIRNQKSDNERPTILVRACART